MKIESQSWVIDQLGEVEATLKVCKDEITAGREAISQAEALIMLNRHIAEIVGRICEEAVRSLPYSQESSRVPKNLFLDGRAFSVGDRRTVDIFFFDEEGNLRSNWQYLKIFRRDLTRTVANRFGLNPQSVEHDISNKQRGRTLDVYPRGKKRGDIQSCFLNQKTIAVISAWLGSGV